MKKIIFLLLTGAVSLTSITHAATLAQCNEIASEVNKTTPMDIDSVTKLMSSICYEDKKKIVLSYRAIVTVDRELTQADVTGIRPQNVNYICTDPDAKTLLDFVDVEYYYSDRNRKFIGRNRISKKDCPKK